MNRVGVLSDTFQKKSWHWQMHKFQTFTHLTTYRGLGGAEPRGGAYFSERTKDWTVDSDGLFISHHPNYPNLNLTVTDILRNLTRHSCEKRSSFLFSILFIPLFHIPRISRVRTRLIYIHQNIRLQSIVSFCFVFFPWRHSLKAIHLCHARTKSFY